MTSDLRARYECAKSMHEKYHNAYENASQKVREAFGNNDVDAMREYFEDVKLYLSLSADAMDEMTQYSKQLRQRYAKV